MAIGELQLPEDDGGLSRLRAHPQQPAGGGFHFMDGAGWQDILQPWDVLGGFRKCQRQGKHTEAQGYRYPCRTRICEPSSLKALPLCELHPGCQACHMRSATPFCWPLQAQTLRSESNAALDPTYPTKPVRGTLFIGHVAADLRHGLKASLKILRCRLWASIHCCLHSSEAMLEPHGA